MIVAIHQPNFLPWLGYFYKLSASDVFVFLDDAQYSKNSFINRNKIKTAQGEIWLTIPVKFNFGQAINEVKINDHDSNWREKHLKTILMNYKKAQFFDEIFTLLDSVYKKQNWERLIDINIELFKEIIGYLQLENEIICSSVLQINDQSTERLAKIVKKLNGDIYLSGAGGAKYQEEEIFKRENITLKYSNFTHPTYQQLWHSFVPNLSIIDVLFNCGKQTRNLLNVV